MGTPMGYPYVGTLSGTHIHLCAHFFSSWSHHVLPSATLRGPQWAPLWGTHMGTLSGTHFSVSLRDFFSFAGSFGPSNGHPYGAPIWVPYRAPISRFHFVKLLPLRGRYVGTYGVPLRGRHTDLLCRNAGAPISLGSTSLSYCPFGAGCMHMGYPSGVGTQACRGTLFARFHFVISFLCGLLRAL